ncbi:MAG: hypothetical protein E2576_11990 [Alcaligenaceae bacterium]|nr:hypothetical protein [Alcaligenaceae bacterium SAGV5]MPS53531.1 hypothetical protein [Alcaligenaceae bacterium SAGV3]MPT57433.1 hypothetical protein [Alcaligenaceae bacterium]
MNAINTPAIETLATSMSEVCIGFERMVCNNEDASIILIRALQRDTLPTAEELAEEWAVELEAEPNREMIELFLSLHRQFGDEWYITCAHYRMREVNADCRGDETAEECPLYGDDIEEVREMWEDRFATFDVKRAKEEAAAMAWIARQKKQAA